MNKQLQNSNLQFLKYSVAHCSFPLKRVGSLRSHKRTDPRGMSMKHFQSLNSSPTEGYIQSPEMRTESRQMFVWARPPNREDESRNQSA